VEEKAEKEEEEKKPLIVEHNEYIYDLNWIFLLFFIRLDVFEVEKVEELAHGNVFTSGTQFGKMGSETFHEHFEASNNIFWDKNLPFYCITISFYFTPKYISNGTRSTSIVVCMQKLSHLEVDLPAFTPVIWEDAVLAPLFMEKVLGT